ncbi:hypothetical protein [Candidatus Fukatsuia endosymbiont of Tuberolachnus salignus]|uniref:hypothetical protein n=1 Tax=Candidatus Fukatsuia endosymbiont of Tuberolachnus salignus TaxID=3077957 RepID=UPI00313B5CBD
MKLKKMSYLAIVLFALTNTAFATTSEELAQQREKVVKKYVNGLGAAKYQEITTIFTKESVVFSTGKGKFNAQEFFKDFLPKVRSASTEFKQYFINTQDADRVAARFYLAFTLKEGNGEKHEGEYMDEFVFEKNSDKLLAVYMFENLKTYNQLK